MSWGYGKCYYCEYWQSGKNRNEKGLCEQSGEQVGGKKAACSAFRLRDEIRAELSGREEECQQY